ncbi:LytTR family DNA-binding domain-containing protein [Chitinophaga sp. HK235]|uniref:LytR/AlgR family response regulator transcription factor n=1 Tax=Chitinophaga sp. HK235 TaxID=2952571 RepID=UPI001BA68675|nr:response regulator transcription factor [Chitinophaga sp. HK235]
MKTKCLLVDDEPLAISLLQRHLEKLDSFEVVATCDNAVRALELLQSQPVDLIFLDIEMPQLSGLTLLKTLKNAPAVIITTAYREFAVEVYDLDVIDYLLKPVTFDRFLRAIERYLRTTDKPLAEVLSSTEKKYIYLKSAHKFIKLHTDEILYIESQKDYIIVYTREKKIMAKYRIGDMEQELKEKGFLRVHRSFMVNVVNITAFTAADVEIGTVLVPIGSSYKEYIFRALNADRYSG